MLNPMNQARLQAARQTIADFQAERETGRAYAPERTAFWCGALSQTVKDLLSLTDDLTAAAEARHTVVTIDLDENTHTHYVLTGALQEYAHRQRGEAEDELADDPKDTTAKVRLEWAEVADKLAGRIEAAL